MKNRNLHSAGFVFSVFLFVCLLITGSPRLIGHSVETDSCMPQRDFAHVDCTFAAAPAAVQEDIGVVRRLQYQQHMSVWTAGFEEELKTTVLSDANGNVLGHRSYMHEVYQAFVLNDGFV